MQDDITYVTREDIDNDKWNTCIDGAGNGLIYAYTYYLDAMCTHWGGLILGDYKAVMPLPFRKKWGIHYIYQPPFIAQLGLFGNALSAPLLQRFIKAIPKKFGYIDYMLNQQNIYPLPLYDLYQRVNYILPLNKHYNNLYEQYKTNTKRNVKKAVQYGCKVARHIDIEAVIALAKEQTVQAEIEQDGFDRFQQLYKQLHANGKSITYGVHSATNELIASCAFVFSHRRAYYILVGNHPNGRTLGASHMLIDAFIQDHADRDLVLDFEGSDVRNVAFFYSSFGATEESYAAIKINRLPWYLKWAKK